MTQDPPVDLVMFGHNQFFGEYVDIMHATGRRLTTVVQNVAETVAEGHRSLSYRIASLKGTPSEGARVVQWSTFEPLQDTGYVMGFAGRQAEPLVSEIRGRWSPSFTSLIHPTATLSPSATLGEGVTVCAGAVIASGAVIGDHVLVNRGATVGHDSRLADHVKIQPGVNLAGFVTVEAGATIGIGASVLENVTIETDAYVAGGACVIRDVAAATMVAGVPAREKKSLTNASPG